MGLWRQNMPSENAPLGLLYFRYVVPLPYSHILQIDEVFHMYIVSDNRGKLTNLLTKRAQKRTEKRTLERSPTLG